MSTATTCNALEADSVRLLSDEVKAVRAKVIGYLLTPAPAGKGLVSMAEVIHHLKRNLENACSEIYGIYRLCPTTVSVDFVYVYSVEKECLKIAGASYNSFHIERAKVDFFKSLPKRVSSSTACVTTISTTERIIQQPWAHGPPSTRHSTRKN